LFVQETRRAPAGLSSAPGRRSSSMSLAAQFFAAGEIALIALIHFIFILKTLEECYAQS
jgi:hypothetical protein